MQLYNSLTRKKEEFIPMDTEEVKIYSCGPTVYNYFHIGNARPFIIFDTLRRYMEYKGWRVKFVQNFTDIDDKMIKRANEEGITVKELADRFIAEYFTDARGLGIQEATVHPKATDHIKEIIKIIKSLIDKGFAYESEGDVYFATAQFDQYGKLSHQPLEDLEAGARIDTSEIKRNPMDFALWKAAKAGEPHWKSPWGEGRPGWHIECSAMANKYLGSTIDIHCGGQDLIFPHHENEIAQSECANSCDFARFWLHNGYINVDNQKMSKSLNNFFTVRDIANLYGYEPIRFFMLSAHYRSPINFSADIIEQAKAGLERIYTCRDNLMFLKAGPYGPVRPETCQAQLLSHKNDFILAMEDDINTADALSSVFNLVKDINTIVNDEANRPSLELLEFCLSLLEDLCNVLGLLSRPYEEQFAQEIWDLIEARKAARAAKNFKEADAIRDRLKEMNIAIEDTKNGAKPVRIK
jgi:cysteinyl-tRNA synthetase